jgi:hypothetical protein
MTAMDVSDRNPLAKPVTNKEIEKIITEMLSPATYHRSSLSSTMLKHLLMKSLCVCTRKSTREVVRRPAPVLVGIRYSRGTSSVIAVRQCFLSKRKRPVTHKKVEKAWKSLNLQTPGKCNANRILYSIP